MITDRVNEWVELAAKVQAEVIASDAAHPGTPISNHDVKRAVLHTRHDMIMVVAMLGGLIHQVDAIDKKSRTLVRLLSVITVLLAIILTRF